MMVSKVCYLQVISPFSQYLCFYNDFNCEIDMPLRKHIQVYVVEISARGSLYVWIYSPWKIGFVASPETSLK
jgi:hypothetical protein